MSIDTILITKNLSDSERVMFQNEFNAVRKDGTVGALLALFLGGIGVHHFYLGNMFAGLIYLLFCWTFVPAIIAFVEIFLMSGRVKRYNSEKAMEIISKIKALRH